ncbi:MAG: histidinol-phosphate transaminase [Gammaproteobacteria bacterium]|nr:histidinol-phosphate transaminase [Gammaproteobacteria bacterium]
MKKINLSSPHIEALEPYMSARRIGGKGNIWLNANELPFPRQPMSLSTENYHRYPDDGPDQLQEAYAGYAGLPTDKVFALRGADEAIDLLIRAYCRAGSDNILVSSPTYGMYQVCAEIQNGGVVDVPLLEDFQLDVSGICARDDVKVLFICNPNNPTGSSFKREDMLTIVRHFQGRALVVIDEAYIEFCPDESLVDELANFENLVVVRTMSKAFGLAGVHVGYLLANESVMSIIRKVAAPYPLADPCCQIALLALEPGNVDLMKDQVAEICQIRDSFYGPLMAMPAVTGVLPSVTNFVLVSFANPDQAWQALTEYGIVARRIPHPRLLQAIRFTIGTKEEMAQVIDVLGALA